MGQITEITEENVEALRELMGEDVVENIGREYFYGLTHFDASEEPSSAIVWCIKNADSFNEVESELFFFGSEDSEEGEELLQEYSDKIQEDNVTRSFFEFENIREDDKAILDDAGFDLKIKEGRNIYLTLKEILETKFAAKKKVPPYIISLGELNLLQFRQGVTNCMFCGRVGINEDLAMLPMEWYEKDISSCMMTDGKVNGFFLIHKKPSGVLMPVLLYATGVDARKDMLNMMRFSVKAAGNKYPLDTKVLICRHDEKTKALSDFLFPDKKGKKRKKRSAK